MFIQIQNKIVNFDKVYNYYYKSATDFTRFTLFVNYDATLENGDIFTFESEDEGIKILKKINQLVNTQNSKTDILEQKQNYLAQQKIDYIKTTWNKIAKQYNLAEIKGFPVTRMKKLKLRLEEQNMTIDDFFNEIKTAIQDSPFLRGKKWHEIPGHPNDSYWEDADWRADFDFFLQPSSLQKAIEGKYADPTLRKERQRNQK